jgi:hypothetical protein
VGGTSQSRGRGWAALAGVRGEGRWQPEFVERVKTDGGSRAARAASVEEAGAGGRCGGGRWPKLMWVALDWRPLWHGWPRRAGVQQQRRREGRRRSQRSVEVCGHGGRVQAWWNRIRVTVGAGGRAHR